MLKELGRTIRRDYRPISDRISNIAKQLGQTLTPSFAPRTIPIVAARSQQRLPRSQAAALAGIDVGFNAGRPLLLTAMLVAGLFIARPGHAQTMDQARHDPQPIGIERVIQSAASGDQALIDPSGWDGRLLTDRKAGVSTKEADLILKLADQGSPLSASARKSLTSALADPRTNISGEQRQKLSDLAATGLSSKDLVSSSSELFSQLPILSDSALDTVSNTKIGAAIERLTQVVDSKSVTPDERLTALSMRAQVVLWAASFDSRGRPAYDAMSKEQLSKIGFADIKAVTKLLSGISDEFVRDEAVRRVVEGMGADFVVTPKEHQLLGNLVEAHKTSQGYAFYPTMDQVFLPDDRPETAAYAFELQKKLSQIAAQGVSAPEAAIAEMKKLMVELKATENRGGPEGVVAASERFALLSDRGGRNNLWSIVDGAVGGYDERDALRFDAAVYLIEHGDPHTLAMHSVVPDRLLWHSDPLLENRPDVLKEVCAVYAAGFDQKDYLVSWHVMAFHLIIDRLSSVDNKAAHQMAERFVEQARAKIAANPAAAAEYLSRIEWMSLDLPANSPFAPIAQFAKSLKPRAS